MASSRGFLKTLSARKTTTRQAPSSAIDYDAVTRTAYELYEQRGRQDGHDFEDWLQAEAIVRGQIALRNRLGNGR